MFAAERELNAERLQAREAMRPALDKLGRGERLSVEERTALDTANARITEIEGELRTYQEARRLSEAAGAAVPDAPEVGSPEEREVSFQRYVRSGLVGAELRAAGEATNSAGGYLVPPGWWQRLQVALKAFGGTAEDFTQLETESGQPMVWATVDPTTTVGQLVGSSNTTGANGQTPGNGASGTGANENNQVGDLDYAFGQGTLSAYMYTSGAQKVSFQLANDSAFDIDQFVSARVGESLGRALALAAISGTGTSQPLGIIPALNAKGAWSAGGSGGFYSLGTATKIHNFGDPAGSTATELLQNTLSPTTLLNMIAAVDPAYRALGAKFYMNDQQMLGLRGQTDVNGRPLINMQDGLSEGAVGTVFGYPVKIDNNIPNLTASTTGGPIFGHLPSAMVKRTVNQSGLLRLNERYADNLQIGFIGYMRFDIRSNDVRAAVTVKPSTT